jgi:tetratricopeptide (TPR) repeat protein
LKSFQKVADQYPYSQVLHTLIAKHHHELKSSDAKATIQRAAIYATDRVVLKKIIESSTQTEAKKSKPVTPEAITATESPVVYAQPATFKSELTGVSDIDQLRKDLYLHLAELQESKKPFESDQSTSTKKKSKKEVSKINNTTSTTTDVKKSKEKASIKKKNKIVVSPTNTTNKKEKTGKSLLSQREQVDLIEKFIQSPPKITKGKIKSSPNEDQEDLSIKSSKIEEDFASENLAQILIKQGNKEKAIDIYKKLIWKFPQKKAYFATQIEGLKK